MPRLTASSAISFGVQWLMGYPLLLGVSHAIAMIWTICSMLKVAGVPERNSSLSTSQMRCSRNVSSPSVSACFKDSCACCHRFRHKRTWWRCSCSCRLIWLLFFPADACKINWARLTNWWGLVRRRARARVLTLSEKGRIIFLQNLC